MFVNGKKVEMAHEQEVTKRKYPNEECDNYQPIKKEKLTDMKNEGISEQEVTEKKIPHEECDNSQPVETEKLADTENDLSERTVLQNPRITTVPICTICKNKKFKNFTGYNSHVKSLNHQRRLKYRSTEVFYCRPCNIEFHGLGDYNDKHITGKRHQTQVTKLKLEMKLKTKVFNKSYKINGITYTYFCNACHRRFENIINYDEHMSGPTHRRTLLEIEMQEGAYCQPCNKVFRSLSTYASHLSTSRHLKNTQ